MLPPRIILRTDFAALYERLRATATEYGTSLIVPSGALVGLDGVLAQQWDSAVITMTKAPHHLEPSPVGIDAVTTLFEGSVAALAQHTGARLTVEKRQPMVGGFGE